MMTRTKTAASARPMIMVDVDGVLNRLTRKTPGGWKRLLVPAESEDVRHYVVNLNPSHGKMLLELAEDTGAELVWCTFWEEKANHVVAPVLGLPRLPVVPIYRRLLWHKSKPSIGQVKAISAVDGAAGRPFVWFDDEPDAAFWTAQHKTGPASVIATDPRHGLDRRHVERARTWLKAQQARAARRAARLAEKEDEPRAA